MMSLRGAQVLASARTNDEAISLFGRNAASRQYRNYEIATLAKVRLTPNDQARNDDEADFVSKLQYAVYILTNAARTVLYTGVTNDLHRRMMQHRAGKGSAFTRKYKVKHLVYYELGDDINAAIFREKQIKAGSRQDKTDLINSFNPLWKDLYEELYEELYERTD